MGKEVQYENLHHSPLGAELTDQQCHALAKVMRPLDLEDGEILIQEGHSDDALYVVINGKLEVTRDVGGGEWVTLHVLKCGDLAGELGFVDGREHSASLRAIGKTEVYSLTRTGLESLILTEPMLVYRVMRTIVRQVHLILVRMNQQYVEMNNYISKQHGRY